MLHIINIVWFIDLLNNKFTGTNRLFVHVSLEIVYYKVRSERFNEIIIIGETAVIAKNLC